MSAPARILVADTPESVLAFRRALTSTFTVVPAETFEQAQAALADPPAVVVCGCHFDEGRLYDLLRHVKATPALASLPFLAVRCEDGDLELDGAMYESVKIAVRALGGNAFVDLVRWQRKYGEAEASHRLTALVQTLAQAPHTDTT